jgi:hypothetical protein
VGVRTLQKSAAPRREKAMTPETIINAYQKVARPIMLRYIGDRQTCVASTRITIETMQCLGLDAEPVAVQLVAECPALKYAYISGFSAQERKQMARRNKRPIQNRGTGGYNGHVIAAVAGRWLVDASIDQIQSVEHGLCLGPTVLVMPLPEDETISLKAMRLEMTGISDEGQRLKIQYCSHWDYSFVNSEAWEFCVAMKFVVARIVAAMTEVVKADAAS